MDAITAMSYSDLNICKFKMIKAKHSANTDKQDYSAKLTWIWSYSNLLRRYLAIMYKCIYV